MYYVHNILTATDHAGNAASAFSNELIVDTSPPLSGKIQISTIGHTPDASSVYLSNDSITVHLSGFDDDESGIDHFEIGVGSQAFFTDILPAQIYNDSNLVVSLQDIDIKDGHIYHIAAKVSTRNIYF